MKVTMVLAAVLSCTPKPPVAPAAAPAAPVEAPAESPAPSITFDTPTAAVQAFLDAAARGDREVLAKVFHADSPGEFAALRAGEASDEDLAELAAFVRGAEITGEEARGDEAMVKVRFAARDEDLHMRRSPEHGWQILDF